MDNEQRYSRFKIICYCHQQWLQGRKPPRPATDLHMRVLVIAGAIVTGCGLREIYLGHQDGTILAGVLLGPAVLIFALSELFSCETWSSFCEGQLESYEPADAGAFHALEAVVMSSGKLEKETLGQWIELERKALATVCSPSTVSEPKDTCEGQP